MLEKNKDYIEMRVSSTDCTFVQNEPTSIRVDGYVYTSYMDMPDPGEMYILISKENFEALRTANRQLQKKIDELRDDISGRSTVIKHYERDVTRLKAKADSNAELARQREINYDFLLKRTGFDSVADLIDYLDSADECDNLYEAISKLHEDYISERDKAKAFEKEIEIYSRTLKEWKEVTGYPSPSAVKTCIEAGASWCHAYNETKKANEKLTEEVDSWKNVTGYSTPEDYMHARISGATPFDYTAAWMKVTGFSTPEKCSSYIDTLEKKLEDIKDLIEED